MLINFYERVIKYAHVFIKNEKIHSSIKFVYTEVEREICSVGKNERDR